MVTRNRNKSITFSALSGWLCQQPKFVVHCGRSSVQSVAAAKDGRREHGKRRITLDNKILLLGKCPLMSSLSIPFRFLWPRKDRTCNRIKSQVYCKQYINRKYSEQDSVYGNTQLSSVCCYEKVFWSRNKYSYRMHYVRVTHSAVIASSKMYIISTWMHLPIGNSADITEYKSIFVI